jgi:hypothetical protein
MKKPKETMRVLLSVVVIVAVLSVCTPTHAVSFNHHPLRRHLGTLHKPSLDSAEHLGVSDAKENTQLEHKLAELSEELENTDQTTISDAAKNELKQREEEEDTTIDKKEEGSDDDEKPKKPETSTKKGPFTTRPTDLKNWWSYVGLCVPKGDNKFDRTFANKIQSYHRNRKDNEDNLKPIVLGRYSTRGRLYSCQGEAELPTKSKCEDRWSMEMTYDNVGEKIEKHDKPDATYWRQFRDDISAFKRSYAFPGVGRAFSGFTVEDNGAQGLFGDVRLSRDDGDRPKLEFLLGDKLSELRAPAFQCEVTDAKRGTLDCGTAKVLTEDNGMKEVGTSKFVEVGRSSRINRNCLSITIVYKYVPTDNSKQTRTYFIAIGIQAMLARGVQDPNAVADQCPADDSPMTIKDYTKDGKINRSNIKHYMDIYDRQLAWKGRDREWGQYKVAAYIVDGKKEKRVEQSFFKKYKWQPIRDLMYGGQVLFNTVNTGKTRMYFKAQCKWQEHRTNLYDVSDREPPIDHWKSTSFFGVTVNPRTHDAFEREFDCIDEYHKTFHRQCQSKRVKDVTGLPLPEIKSCKGTVTKNCVHAEVVFGKEGTDLSVKLVLHADLLQDAWHYHED